MGAASRGKWNKRAKRYNELLASKGKSVAEEYKATFDKPWKLDAVVNKAKV